MDVITISREQQEELDQVLGEAYLSGGMDEADRMMRAYRLGREHGLAQVQ